MTQRRRNRHRKRRVGRRAFLIGLGGSVSAALTYYLLRSCLLHTSPSPRDGLLSRMPSSA